MTKTKIELKQVQLLFNNELEAFKEKNGESKAYRFSRATLDAALLKKFPKSSSTERTNAITAFIKYEGMSIKKVSHGVYEYIDGYLNKYLVFDTIAKAVEQISNAKISVEDDLDSKELKELCVLAYQAETKLKDVFKDLLSLVPGFEAEYKAHQNDIVE